MVRSRIQAIIKKQRLLIVIATLFLAPSRAEGVWLYLLFSGLSQVYIFTLSFSLSSQDRRSLKCIVLFFWLLLLHYMHTYVVMDALHVT